MAKKTLLVFLGILTSSITADRIVMTNNGPIQGITVHSGELDVEAFLGIPFAEPPLGRLRFQRPVPKTSWMGVYDASTFAPVCIQNVTNNHYYEPNVENMTEDCLHLNLWVPYSKNTNPKTIMIFIHGGAFNLGSSNMALYDGTNLAKMGDVIIGTVNYRVGALGWFSAFIDKANGNMGAYDSLLAARWIKDNAHSFGGDANKIVLFGESAGAMISSGHLVSPLARNLFQKVIMQSGAAMSPMILTNNEILYKRSQKFAELTGCADERVTLKDDPDLIVKCLQRVSTQKLASAEGLMKSTNPITFIPRVGDSYLPKSTVHLMQEGHFQDGPVLTGINEFEGTFFLSATASQYFGVHGHNNIQSVSRRLGHQLVQIIYKNTEQKKPKDIADFYINNIANATSDMYTLAIAESLGDYLITCPSIFFAEFYALRNPVHYYKFIRRPATTILADWMGTTHFDEMQYVFGNPLFSSNFTEEEEALSHRIMSRWLQFAKTSDPNIPGELTWPLYTHDNPQYLEMSDEETLKLKPADDRCEFWRQRFQATYDRDIVNKVKRDTFQTALNSGVIVAASNILLVSGSLLLLALKKTGCAR